MRQRRVDIETENTRNTWIERQIERDRLKERKRWTDRDTDKHRDGEEN